MPSRPALVYDALETGNRLNPFTLCAMASAASSAASPETEELKAIHHSPLSGPSDSQQAMTGQLSNLLLAADPDTSDPSEAVLVTSAQERLVKPLRNLAYLNCLALVIGLQIGSGIYSAPAIVSSHVSSAAVGVFIWVLAGALVWTGAASFIELGIALPSNGGIQEYLRHCYGDIYGFLFAWTWIAVVKPCSMAMISLIFSEYLYKAVSPKAEVSVFILKATALLGLASITALNCLGTRTGVDTAKIFMVIKLFGLGSITVIGLAAEAMSIGHEGVRHRSNQTSPETIPPQALPTPLTQLPSIWSTSKDLADAIFAALFSYGGWESVNYLLSKCQTTLTRP